MYQVGGLMFIPISNGTQTFGKESSKQKYIVASWAEVYINSILTEEEILKQWPDAKKMKCIKMHEEL